MLIWRLIKPGKPSVDDLQWMPRSESFANIRSRVDSWLTAAGSGLAKAGIHDLTGFGKRRAFTCPECKDIVRSRWVMALPAAAWSLTAEGGTAREEARDVLKHRPPLPPLGSTRVRSVETREPDPQVEPPPRAPG